MRFSPYQCEVTQLGYMSEGQLLEYFLTRVFETEEIWGHDDGCEWVTTQQHNHWVMYLWPYQQLAKEALAVDNVSLTAAAESLEDFIDTTLPTLIEDDIMVVVMASAQSPGCLVAPHRLLQILTGMMESGQYVLDC